MHGWLRCGYTPFVTARLRLRLVTFLRTVVVVLPVCSSTFFVRYAFTFATVTVTRSRLPGCSLRFTGYGCCLPPAVTGYARWLLPHAARTCRYLPGWTFRYAFTHHTLHYGYVPHAVCAPPRCHTRAACSSARCRAVGLPPPTLPTFTLPYTGLVLPRCLDYRSAVHTLRFVPVPSYTPLRSTVLPRFQLPPHTTYTTPVYCPFYAAGCPALPALVTCRCAFLPPRFCLWLFAAHARGCCSAVTRFNCTTHLVYCSFCWLPFPGCTPAVLVVTVTVNIHTVTFVWFWFATRLLRCSAAAVTHGYAGCTFTLRITGLFWFMPFVTATLRYIHGWMRLHLLPRLHWILVLRAAVGYTFCPTTYRLRCLPHTPYHSSGCPRYAVTTRLPRLPIHVRLPYIPHTTPLPAVLVGCTVCRVAGCTCRTPAVYAVVTYTVTQTRTPLHTTRLLRFAPRVLPVGWLLRLPVTVYRLVRFLIWLVVLHDLVRRHCLCATPHTAARILPVGLVRVYSTGWLRCVLYRILGSVATFRIVPFYQFCRVLRTVYAFCYIHTHTLVGCYLYLPVAVTGYRTVYLPHTTHLTVYTPPATRGCRLHTDLVTHFVVHRWLCHTFAVHLATVPHTHTRSCPLLITVTTVTRSVAVCLAVTYGCYTTHAF